MSQRVKQALVYLIAAQIDLHNSENQLKKNQNMIEEIGNNCQKIKSELNQFKL